MLPRLLQTSNVSRLDGTPAFQIAMEGGRKIGVLISFSNVPKKTTPHYVGKYKQRRFQHPLGHTKGCKLDITETNSHLARGIFDVSNATGNLSVSQPCRYDVERGSGPSTREARASPKRQVCFNRSKAVYVNTPEPGSFAELLYCNSPFNSNQLHIRRII